MLEAFVTAQSLPGCLCCRWGAFIAEQQLRHT